MPRDRSFDWLMQRVLRHDRAWAAAHGDRPGESVLTLLLATASLGLGLVALAAALGGIAGFLMAPWNMPYEIYNDAAAPGPPVTTILGLSPAGMILALVGAVLGAAGIAVRRSRRRVPVLSATGLLACVLSVIGGLTYELIMALTH